MWLIDYLGWLMRRVWVCSFLLLFVAFSCTSDDSSHAKNNAMPTMAPTVPAGYAEVVVDPRRRQLFGVQTAPVIYRKLGKKVRAVGMVMADERRIANIQTKFSGWIVDLYVNFTNMPVTKGEPLFSVYSPELFATQEEYIIAKKSQVLANSVRKRLELWDVPSEELRRLDEQLAPTYTLTIRSPISGIVLEKNAFAGMNVGPGMNIFVVANLEHVWVVADIFEHDISSIQLGQEATFTLTAFPGKVFTGKVDFINYVLDQPTRTIKTRFDFDNPHMLLKPGMYGTIEFAIPLGILLAVPEEAVIDTGTRKIVFVEKDPSHYLPVEVQIGAKGDGFYQVLSGLSENDRVVTSAQFLFDSESRIRASGGGMEGMEMK